MVLTKPAHDSYLSSHKIFMVLLVDLFLGKKVPMSSTFPYTPANPSTVAGMCRNIAASQQPLIWLKINYPVNSFVVS